MLQYFRINDPYRVIGLLVILLVLFSPFLIDVADLTFPELKSIIIGDRVLNGSGLYTGVIDSTAPFTGWLYALVSAITGESLAARHALAFVILFLEAVLLGVIFIDKKAFPDSSFIPSLMFGILCVFSFDTVSISGHLVGTVFLLVTLNYLFREIEFREENYEIIMRTGFFLGISSLFEFSFSVYLFPILITLILYTRTSGRKIALFIIGYLLPHMLIVSIYFINGGAAELWYYFYLPNLEFGNMSYVGIRDMLTLMGIPVFFVLAALIIVNRESRFTKYQSQLLQAMFFWTVFSILQVYYSRDIRPHSFIPVMIGFSFYLSHLFLMIRRRRFAEIAFWIFFLGVIGLSLFARYSSRYETMYGDLIVPKGPAPYENKKLVVLSDSLALYQGSQMTTPFFNWRLSKEIFEEPDYYENVTKVHEGFKDHPDVIVDPQDLMKPFFERMPELRKNYTRSPEGYRRKL